MKIDSQRHNNSVRASVKMEITLTIKNVVLNDNNLWHDHKIHPDVISDVSDIQIKWDYDGFLIVRDNVKLYNNIREFNNKNTYIFMLIKGILKKYTRKKNCIRVFFTKERDIYALYIRNARYIFDIKYNDSIYCVDMSPQKASMGSNKTLDKIRRIFLTCVLLREYPTTIDYDIVFNHLLTKEYKKNEYSRDLLDIFDPPIIYDHAKCIQYIKKLSLPLHVNMENALYMREFTGPLPKDLMNIVIWYNLNLE